MEPNNLSLIEAKNLFINHLKAKNKASATILAYKKDIDQLIVFVQKGGKIAIQEVATADIEAFLNGIAKSFSQKTISRKINAIKTFFRFLFAEKLVNQNIALPIAHPKIENKLPRILSKIEYRALRDACRNDVRVSAITETLLQTGIRISELANLTINDVKNNTLVVRVLEKHQGREIPLNKSAKIALDQYLKARSETTVDNIFITKNKRPLLIRNIRSLIDRYFKKAGIKDACVNDLRHTFIFQQLSSGVPLAIVSKIAGHKRLTSTQKYLELVKEEVGKKTKLKEL